MEISGAVHERKTNFEKTDYKIYAFKLKSTDTHRESNNKITLLCVLCMLSFHYSLKKVKLWKQNSLKSCLKEIQQGFYTTYENLVLRSLGMVWLPR